MQAMILAAGFGSRLQPYTAIRPKPLFPVLNKPLLLLTIKRLRRLGFDHIVINCHHLKEQIAAAIDGLDGVVLQEEDTILGTGGGLKKALPSFRNEPLLVTNADIYHTIDLAGLYQKHCENDSKVTLAMHHFPRYNTVPVAGHKVVGFAKKNCSDSLAFTGVHVLEPEILEGIEDGVFSCIIDRYNALLAKQLEICCLRVDGSFWTDMGTVEDYLALHQGLLLGMIPRWRELAGEGAFTIAKEAKLAKDLVLKDWACIGKAEIAARVCLAKVVVWDGARIMPGALLQNKIVTAGV